MVLNITFLQIALVLKHKRWVISQKKFEMIIVHLHLPYVSRAYGYMVPIGNESSTSGQKRSLQQGQAQTSHYSWNKVPVRVIHQFLTPTTIWPLGFETKGADCLAGSHLAKENIVLRRIRWKILRVIAHNVAGDSLLMSNHAYSGVLFP